MSILSRKNRNAFRPALGDIRLEERVVLNGSTLTSAALVAHASTGTGGGAATAQAGLENLTTRQIRNAYRQQFNTTRTALRQFANAQLNALRNDPANFGLNGHFTSEALANFNAGIAGGINAAALRLSAQSSLLPGAGRQFVPRLQNSLMGSGTTSLVNRISNILDSRRLNQPAASLQNMVNRQINRSFINNSARLAGFFNSTPLNRLSTDPTTGQRVPLAQFLANQAATQTNNVFGTLANSVGPNARTALFDSTGTFNPQGLAAFQQQYANALGTAGFQTSSLLSLFPNAARTFGPQFQSAFFGTGIDPLTGLPSTSFLNGFSGVFPTGTGTAGTTPFTSDAFNTGFQNAFTTSFQNFTTPLNNFLGIRPTLGTGNTSGLPTGFFQTGATFPSPFGTQFTGNTFNSGFNNGFVTGGTGFPGFGTAPSGFNTSFGTGFNSFANNLNQQFGLTLPTFGTGFGTTTPTTTTGGGFGTTTGGTTVLM